jgi:EH_Signature domain
MPAVNNQLDALKVALNRANDSALNRDFYQIDLEPTVRKLKAQVGSGTNPFESIDRIQNALSSYTADRKLNELQQARYASFGVHIPFGVSNHSVLEDAAALEVFLGNDKGIGQWKTKPAWYRRAMQGLVISYFTFDPYAADVSEKKREGWITIRNYLFANIEYAAEEHNPEWLQCCIEHRSLFTDRPGQSFAQKLLNGDQEELENVLELLRAKESWFPRELVLGQVRHVVDTYDAESFQEMVDPLLNMLAEHKTILDDGLCLLINRYAIHSNLPMHVRLKELIVLRWDNPWLQGSTKKWHPNATKGAKDLVAEWLTGEFIEAFFTKLAEEADSDTRRMDFWMTYRKQMNHVRFALGTDFLRSTDPDVVFLKNKMRGLYSKIVGRAKSNAFIMFMGDVIAVEFGAANNALYLYSTSSGMPFELNQDLLETVDGRNSLKSKRLGDSYTHQDVQGGYKCWEQRIADELYINFGVSSDTWTPSKFATAKKIANSSGGSTGLYASTGGLSGDKSSARSIEEIPVFKQRTASTASNVLVGRTSWADLFAKPYTVELLLETARVFDFRVEDNKSIGGAIWVRVDGDNPTRNRVLRNWGFQYKANKGWWR